jgi:hypothetical protein
MKKLQLTLLLIFAAFAFNTSYAQLPASDPLYKTIAGLDSILFRAYNTCDMKTQNAMYSDTLEFFHDHGGLDTSKRSVLAGIERNICNKVTRELIKGSLEVHRIPGYGAIEIGLHQFHNKMEPDAKPHPSQFIIFWRQRGNEWKIAKVVSLH